MASCVLKFACRGPFQRLCLYRFDRGDCSFRSFLPLARAVSGTVEVCRGGARWPVAFSNLLVEDHSKSCAFTSLTEVIAASVRFFHLHGQFQGQWKYVEVVLGGQLRSQNCL